eukprot:m.354902 g.354902  ORF g.354902 m.354902 type:complete len:60 (+) comp17130_c0_seq1:2057-2236(+)
MHSAWATLFVKVHTSKVKTPTKKKCASKQLYIHDRTRADKVNWQQLVNAQLNPADTETP